MAGPQLPPGYRLAVPPQQPPSSLPPGYRLAPTAPAVADRLPLAAAAYRDAGLEPPSPEVLAGIMALPPSPPAQYRPQPPLDPNAVPRVPPVGDLQLPSRPDDGVPDTYALPGTNRPMDALAQGGFRSIADTAAIPFDLSNLLANAGLSLADAGANVFGGEVPFRFQLGGVGNAIANTAADIAAPLGLPAEDPADMTNAERVLYNTGRFAGGAGLQGGGLRAVAGARPPSTAVRRFDPLIKPYEGPGGARTVARDVAAGAGAGVGIGTYENVVGEENVGPIGALLSMLAGGVGGATLFDLPSGVTKIGRQIGRTLTDRNIDYNDAGFATRRGDAQDAARYLQGQARADGPTGVDDALASLRRTLEMAADFGMPVPPIGQATQSVGLGRVERDLMNRTEGVPIGNRNQEVNQWAADQVTGIAPNADPNAFVDAAGQAANATLGPVRTAATTAQGQVDAATAARTAQGQQFTDQYGGNWFATDGPGASLGEAVVDRSMVPTLENSSARYAAVDPRRIGEIDAEPLVDAATRVANTLGNFNDPNKVIPRGLLARINNRIEVDEDGNQVGIIPTTVGDLTAAIPEISATERRIRASAQPDWVLLDNLRELRTTMQGMIREAAGGTGAPMVPRAPSVGAGTSGAGLPGRSSLDPNTVTPGYQPVAAQSTGVDGYARRVSNRPEPIPTIEVGSGFTPDRQSADAFADSLAGAYQAVDARSRYPGTGPIPLDEVARELGYTSLQQRQEFAARLHNLALNNDAAVARGLELNAASRPSGRGDTFDVRTQSGVRNYNTLYMRQPAAGGQAPPVPAGGAPPVGTGPLPAGGAQPPGDPTTDAARRWVAAQENFEQNVAPIYGQRDAAEELRHDFNADRAGRSQIPASGIPGRFIQEPTFTGGQAENAASLERIRTGSPDPAAVTSIDRDRAALIMGRAADSIMHEGAIDPMRLAGFMQRWGPVIDTAPGLRQQFDRLLDEARTGATQETAFTRALATAQGTLKQTEQEVADSALSLVIGSNLRNPASHDRAIAAIVSSRNPAAKMTDLRTRLAGIPGAQESLERAVADHIYRGITNTGTADNLPISWAKLVRTLENPNTDAMLAATFENSEAMQALQRVRTVFDLRGILQRASGAPGSATASNMEGAFRFMEAGLRTVYGGFRGGNITRNLKVALGPWMRSRNNPVQELVARAAVDPDVAEHLLSMELRDNPQAWGSKLARLMRWEEFARQANEDWWSGQQQ